MKIPKAFISYSHDSQDHKKWVLDLATRLRNTGVDAILDQWDLKPGDDLPVFMERNLTVADRVLMVCTERYVEKANSGSGGVGYEKMIVTSDMLKSIDSNKVIPLIRQTTSHAVPTFLKTKLFLDFSREDQLEFAFDELVRTIHGTPLFVKPKVGNNPFAAVSTTPPEKSGDLVLGLMKVVLTIFDSHSRDFVNYDAVRKAFGASRIMLDLTIGKAKAEGLITQDNDKDLRFTEKGVSYVINHNLAKLGTA